MKDLSLNLLDIAENSVKAEATLTQLLLTQEGSILTFQVVDDGKGMTEDQLLHITEPFYRTDKSRSRAEGGAGLGLALCKQIVHTHGAEMRFESEFGKGTEIFVTFTSWQ